MMHLLCGRQTSSGVDRKIAMSCQKLVRRVGKRGKGKGQFQSPCGVAVTKSGDVVVADTENHRIQIFTKDGFFKSKFGSKGYKVDQLNYPMSVVVTKDDHVAVTDSVNACVKIFSLDGQLIQVLGCSELFDIPYGLGLSSDNYFVVTDICKHRIVVLNPEGTAENIFGEYGSQPNDFDHPYFVTVTNDNQIVVTDTGNNSIKIFTFKGKLLKMFSQNEFKLGSDIFISLQGLCTDADGNVLIICNNSVYILTKNGRLWEILTPSDGTASPKCITYVTSGHLILTQYDPDSRHEICIFRYNKDDYRSLNSTQFYAINI